jgi:hypothetical protein
MSCWFNGVGEGTTDGLSFGVAVSCEEGVRLTSEEGVRLISEEGVGPTSEEGVGPISSKGVELTSGEGVGLTSGEAITTDRELSFPVNPEGDEGTVGVGEGTGTPSGRTFALAGIVFKTIFPRLGSVRRWNTKKAIDTKDRMRKMPTIASHDLRVAGVPTTGCGFAIELVALFNRFSTSIALWGRWTGSFAKQAATVSSQFFGIASPSIPSSALRSVIEGGTFPLTWASTSPS